MITSFCTEQELRNIGLQSIGKNVCISKKASFYDAGNISVGNHVRIDDFCILSGKINMGSYIHISAYTALYGKYGIILEDFVTVSGRVFIYSQSDDYSGDFMTNPMLPGHLRHEISGAVTLGKFAIVGAGSIILPGVTIGEGAGIGAMSLVNTDVERWKIYAGIPARMKKDRSKKLLELYKKYQETLRD